MTISLYPRRLRQALLAGSIVATAALATACDVSTASTAANTNSAAAASTAGTASSSAKPTQPGALTLVPASGATTVTPTWSTKNTCPAGDGGSSELVAFNKQGVFESRISAPIEGPGPYKSAPGSGVLDFDMNSVRLYATPDVGANGTIEVAVGCYPDGEGLGKAVYVQAIYVHFSGNGKKYTTSSSG
jgi:hypothetical protein